MAKYQPLNEYLRACSAAMLTLSFAEIERIIGAELPPSARKYRAWWANDRTHVHALSWLGAGRRVDTVNFQTQQVTFAYE